MKATEEGILIPWDKFSDLLAVVNDAMRYNSEGLEKEQRRRVERSPTAIDAWKRDRTRAHRIGTMLVDAYKEAHPGIEVRYAEPTEGEEAPDHG